MGKDTFSECLRGDLMSQITTTKFCGRSCGMHYHQFSFNAEQHTGTNRLLLGKLKEHNVLETSLFQADHHLS